MWKEIKSRLLKANFIIIDVYKRQSLKCVGVDSVGKSAGDLRHDSTDLCMHKFDNVPK